MSAQQCHQPIGFVCCHCRYRSSGSFCSNPDRLDCPHRGFPRCQQCPILFTPSRSSSGEDIEADTTRRDAAGTTQERHSSFDSGTSDVSLCEEPSSSNESI
ncbi:hypothetical protein F4819DRAFT_484952 [Hypoxylon fuscum]|nr:hypothetical protein F4819DRAFT_484952 [Hypoxylon fuscum]